MKSLKVIFFCFFVFLTLGNIFVSYVSGFPFQGMLFNSDALYLPTLFADIFQNNGQIKDWFLTPAPYFFPDYPVFMLAYLMGMTPYSQIISFALIQTTLTFFAIWLVARVTTNVHSFIVASVALIVLIWLALSSGEPFAFILNSAFHYGAFLSAILLVALWIKFNNEDKSKKNKVIFFFIAAITCVTTLSDNILLVQFIAPVIATQVLTSIAVRDFSFKNKVPLILLTISGLLGTILYKFIVTNQTRYPTYIGVDKVFLNIIDIYELFHSTITNSPVFGVIFLLYIIIVINYFTQLMTGKGDGSKLSWLVIFSFLSFLATIGSVSLVTNLPVTIRYFIPAYSWPVIIVFIFLSYRLRNHFFTLASVTSLLALMSMTWSSYHLIVSNGIEKQYYPEDISCIDNALEKENLNNGIAQYWDAKYLKNFSKLDLNIAQHFERLDEMHWITSKEYFKQSYDFAIISENANSPYKLSSEVLVRINGAPKSVEHCGSRLLLMYDKDKMRVRKIISVGDSYTWKACELPTRIGEKTANCEMQKKDNVQQGYVTYGPYEPLKTGQYTFEIKYSSSASKRDSVGDWDVVIALPNEGKILEKGSIIGTDGVPERLVGNFTFDSEKDLTNIEIRTFARSNVDLKIIDLRIVRVQ